MRYMLEKLLNRLTQPVHTQLSSLKCNILLFGTTNTALTNVGLQTTSHLFKDGVILNAMPKPKKRGEKRRVKAGNLKDKVPRSKSVVVNLSGNADSTSARLAKDSTITHPARAINVGISNKPKRSKKKPKTTNDATAVITKSLSKLDINSNNRLPTKKSPNARFFSSQSAGSSRTSRVKLETLEDVGRFIVARRAKNIVVMVGAGISTASGIPDFRTPGTGLYDNLQRYNVPYPTAIFDLDYFKEKPKPFFELAKELYPSGKYRPNLAHYFLRCLHEKGILLRVYSQNIDGLERLAGIPPAKIVEAHGTFMTATCQKCGKKYDGDAIKQKIFKGAVPRCQSMCWGVVKPDIVFFGEDLPKRFYYYLKDFPVCDLLMVMGTSLEVEPFASLVDSIRFNVPRLLLNREKVGPFKKRGRPTDIAVTGDLTEIIERFSTVLGWKKFLEEVMEEHESKTENDQKENLSETQTDSGISSASSVASEQKEGTVKPTPPKIDKNIKRYFHTIRSTPLPKYKGQRKSEEYGSGEPSASIPSNLSYYNFLKNTSKPQNSNTGACAGEGPALNSPGRQLKNIYALSKTHAPTIQYTRTVMKAQGTKQRSVSMPTILRRIATSSDSSDSRSETSDSDESSDF
ncbi:uncharacterized protein LOC143463134 isoform X2 [Clavelina lepadiformis]|uniref:uncharacterized protein LOC143463134 isoform X2 n=1 Tax=Clavelina lepadiformis TaxID=159417 RepID=UPI0040410C4F